MRCTTKCPPPVTEAGGHSGGHPRGLMNKARDRDTAFQPLCLVSSASSVWSWRCCILSRFSRLFGRGVTPVTPVTPLPRYPGYPSPPSWLHYCHSHLSASLAAHPNILMPCDLSLHHPPAPCPLPPRPAARSLKSSHTIATRLLTAASRASAAGGAHGDAKLHQISRSLGSFSTRHPLLNKFCTV